ncbi:MAG: hypothetical protein OEX11_06295, partial [Nitrosomonas sp.]|nr:hypothetical protein [Nitrosomonas sp.]
MHIGVMGILAFSFLLWRWYQVFKICHVPVLGAALVSYIFFSGLTATFMLQNRIPILLLLITAVVICWKKESFKVSKLTI